MSTPVANDEYIWQTKVPAMSLEHDFLLNGLFAITAFEIATSTGRDRHDYVDAGIAYQTLAVSSFRTQLPNIQPDSFEAMLCFSLMLMVLALASAKFSSQTGEFESPNMVQSMLTHFELLRGCAVVMDNQPTFIEQSPYIRRLKRFAELPQVPLDVAADAAITRLSEANELRVASSMADPYERRVEQVAFWQAYSEYKGYALAWLNMAGEDYVKAIKANDGIALLTLMYWGVLAETLGQEIWWAKGFGCLLINDISTQRLDDSVQALARDLVSSAWNLIQENLVTKATT
ncbi:hypothetical protein LTS07_004671 [Exophiala sideris]|uniref:Transcription factor domain-containing protein n=1 Tax=Exophiala sideris TaxID=1016849 RepID=A0ABR0JCQ6_9EURO|nr:hypothetical protein LTS07_004671 [Exophiala sideris]KAK5040977.1 hypothetical protein LTR13_003279 [Exophiala sideris]KAK5061689.1 hypothetical protein LTR69_004871 [Exophiala sideris]